MFFLLWLKFLQVIYFEVIKLNLIGGVNEWMSDSLSQTTVPKIDRQLFIMSRFHFKYEIPPTCEPIWQDISKLYINICK